MGRASVALGSVVVIGALMLTSCSSPSPAETPVAEPLSSANTPESAPVETEDAGAASGAIPASTPPEELARISYQRTESITNTGADNPGYLDEILLAYAEGEISSDQEFIAPIIEEKMEQFAQDNFVNGWRDIPDLAAYYDRVKANALSAFETWSRTYQSGNSEDVEPFRYFLTLNEVSMIESSDTTATSRIAFIEDVNIEQNRGLELQPEWAPYNDNQVVAEMKHTVEDGAWKISGYTVVSTS